MGLREFALGIALFVSAFGLVNQATAAPWADPGNEQLRHHIEVLADAGIIKAPITTWPIMWAAIAHDIENPATENLTDAQRWSLAYVRFAFNQAKRRFNVYGYAGVRSDPEAVRDFSSDQREKSEFKAEADWLGESLAGRLRFTWTENPVDGKKYRFDGSYVAGLLGNWSVSAGKIDRWWGPGWQSSLILSDNARPVPGITLQRNFSDPFETPLLSWMGPWTLTLFAGELESNRAVPNAKLLGERLAFRPLTSLEIGISRTAQWGGQGRPQSLRNLLDSLLVVGENKVYGPGQVDNNPGNQLAGFDLRWSFPFLHTDSAFYLQYTGEDASNGFPTKALHLVGLESAFKIGQAYNHIAVEYTDTMSGGYINPMSNVAYEHYIYQSGYRYYSRPIGSSLDNDTRAVSLMVDHYFPDGNQLSWKVVKMNLNRDGTSVTNGWGGSVYGPKATQTTLLEVSYAYIYHDLKITPSVYNFSHEITWNNEKINGTGAGLSLEYKM